MVDRRVGYVSDDSQPTLDIICKLAIDLCVSADMLVFDESERETGDEFKLQFEAISRLEPGERNIIKELIEGMIVKYESKHWNKVI